MIPSFVSAKYNPLDREDFWQETSDTKMIAKVVIIFFISIAFILMHPVIGIVLRIREKQLVLLAAGNFLGLTYTL